jgi:putative membrane protein
MPRFLIKFIIGALALWAATKVVRGLSIEDTTTLLIAALLLGFANAIVRPVLIILTLPLTLVTLGLFLLVINGAMIGLVAWLLPGMSVDGLWSAILASLVIWVVSWAGEMILGVRKPQTD